MGDQKGKVLRIVRHLRDENGQIVPKETLVWDPRVIKQYMQHRYQQEAVTTKYAALSHPVRILIVLILLQT